MTQQHADHLSRRTFVKGLGTAAAASVVGVPDSPGERTTSGRFPRLSLVPFLARPTPDSILISARNGDEPAQGSIQVRRTDADEWELNGEALTAAPGAFFDWTVTGLDSSTAYQYRVMLGPPSETPGPVATGSFTTQRTDDTPYTAVIMTDPHVGTFPDGRPEIQVFADVVRNARRDGPEFALALGDNVAWSTSRNVPQANDEGAVNAYTLYRRHLGALSIHTPQFGAIGNWEGESGKFPHAAIETVAAVRRQYTPNPTATTYPEGGSPGHDYYAFTWGPVLYVVLNVQTYTRPSGTAPDPRDDVSRVEDWTLGQTQFAWLERTLAASTSPFIFICIHHAVGGDAGNPRETLYGRGGARCIDTGEQIRLHALMQEHDVQIFFYGHDHVFVDDVADGIHYSLPGSCGAPWRFGSDVTGYERFWSDAGHARVRVERDRVRVEYVSLTGLVFHEFEVRAGKR